MKRLTKRDFELILGAGDYDYSKPIYLYVPSTSFEQPIIMYTSKKHKSTMHYLSNELKESFIAGMYSYNLIKDGV